MHEHPWIEEKALADAFGEWAAESRDLAEEAAPAVAEVVLGDEG